MPDQVTEPEIPYGKPTKVMPHPNTFQLQLLGWLQDGRNESDLTNLAGKIADVFHEQLRNKLNVVLAKNNLTLEDFDEFLTAKGEEEKDFSKVSTSDLAESVIPEDGIKGISPDALSIVNLFAWEMNEVESKSANRQVGQWHLEQLEDSISELTENWSDEDVDAFLNNDDQ